MQERAKRVVLTGAGGFLGSRLLPALALAGLSVTAVTSRSRDALEASCGTGLGDLGVDVAAADDRSAIAAAMAGADVLVSCGFPRGGDGRAMARGLEFISWLFQTAAASGVGAVVNVSSQSVYDQHRDHPAREDDPVCPVGDYAIAKYATELMLEALCAGIPHTNVRLASLIGPGFDQRVLNKMVKRALAGERIEVQENGSIFGYLDVRDAASGLASLATADPVEWSQVYNLGQEGGVTLSEMAYTARNAAIACGALDAGEPAITLCGGDRRNSELDSSFFRRELLWSPSFALEASTAAICAAVAKEARA